MNVLYGVSCKPETIFFDDHHQRRWISVTKRADDPGVGLKFHKNAFVFPWHDSAARVTG